MAELRTKVLEELNWSYYPMSVGQLAVRLGVSTSIVRATVSRLLAEGKVEHYIGTNKIQLSKG